MASWMVKLAGDEHDLKTLSTLYTAPDCRVAKDDDGSYYLTSDEFAAMTDDAAVERKANELLVCINPLTSLHNSGFEPVSLDGVYSLNADGTKAHHILLRATLSALGRLSAELTILGPDGQPIPSAEPALAQQRLKLALHDPKVMLILSLWRGCTPSDAGLWVYLYKIYEIIGAEMAGGDKNKVKQTLKGCGWATQEELDNFGEAANNPDVTGENARHGAGWVTKPQVKPLTSAEAIVFIQLLIERWLNWKMAQTP